MPNIQKQVIHTLYQTDPWDGFETSHDNAAVQGWNGNHPLLTRLVSTARPVIILDVGVWKGQSTINMAKAMKDANIDGCVISIDTFLGSPEHWRGSGEMLLERRHGFPNLYQQFMSNVKNANLEDYVVPLPQTAESAVAVLAQFGIKANLVHIDAAHDYESVKRDAELYWQVLSEPGFMVGDDYHETWPGVIKAAGELSASLAKPLYIEAPKWLLRK